MTLAFWLTLLQKVNIWQIFMKYFMWIGSGQREKLLNFEKIMDQTLDTKCPHSLEMLSGAWWKSVLYECFLVVNVIKVYCAHHSMPLEYFVPNIKSLQFNYCFCHHLIGIYVSIICDI